MDSQESQLRKTLINSGVQVKREGDNIRLIMPEKITFDSNHADLRVSFIEILDSVVLVLRKYSDTLLKIVGHTDSVGSESYNLDLSERRANTVARYLISQGIAPRRIQAYGAGEGFPVATNETESGRSENRRVELSIAPNQK